MFHLFFSFLFNIWWQVDQAGFAVILFSSQEPVLPWTLSSFDLGVLDLRPFVHLFVVNKKN